MVQGPSCPQVAISTISHCHVSLYRYGFHGTSHQYVVGEVGDCLWPGARLVSCHLGAGCSLAAARVGEGTSRDTSMGFSPLSGLMMGTRAGDVDPSVLTYISRQLEISPDQVINHLNHHSGFLGIAGTSDSRLTFISLTFNIYYFLLTTPRELEAQYLEGDSQAGLAVEMFCYNVAKTIASYTVPLAGLDAIVFTGGIGEKSFIKRRKIAGKIKTDKKYFHVNCLMYSLYLEYLSALGVSLDTELNNINGSSSFGKISSSDSKVSVFVIKTDEELMIAKQVSRLFSKT